MEHSPFYEETFVSETTRRAFIRVGGAATCAALASAASSGNEPALSFSDRAHIFVHPTYREALTSCMTTVVGCPAPVALPAPGLPEPLLAFRFPGGGSFSVEFTERALTERQARYGAWLEIKVADVAALKEKILRSGLPQVHYPATSTFYFSAPGGQVFGIVPLPATQGLTHRDDVPSVMELENRPTNVARE